MASGKDWGKFGCGIIGMIILLPILLILAGGAAKAAGGGIIGTIAILAVIVSVFLKD